MPLNTIGFKGATQLRPRVDVSQPSGGPQVIAKIDGVMPVALQPGQSFILPAGQWMISPGRYTDLQVYDSTSYRWRNYQTQPGQTWPISSDGQNFRLCNTTGTPVGAVISNLGAGNATNGYNTVTATPSAGNSSWGTLVGGAMNGNACLSCNVVNGGNFSLPPILVWQPASNQTYPYIAPEFCCNISANAINTITVNYGGAGLTAPGSLTAVNQPGDTNPGNASITFNSTLANSGNLTAIWPLTQGTEVTSLPTFTFNIGGGMCANVLMDWTCSNFTVASCGFNYGATKPVTILSGNGIAGHTQNASLAGTSYTTKLAMPRMTWLSATTDANSNISTNGNLTVVDAGKNLQAIPFLIVIAGNANGNGPNGNNPVILTPIVGGLTDTSYMTAF